MRWVALLCLMLAFGGGAGADQVQVQRMPDVPPGKIGLRDELRYSLTQSQVTAVLSYVPTSQTLILRFDDHPAPMNLADQAKLLEPLFARFLRDQKPAHLTLLLADHAEIVSRLAAVLSRCANWNGRTGRPVRGTLDQFLVDTLNSHDLAGEIAAVFTTQGYRFRATGASMISEGHVSDITDRLVPIGIAYLSFVADLSPDNRGRTPWPTQSHHLTC